MQEARLFSGAPDNPAFLNIVPEGVDSGIGIATPAGADGHRVDVEIHVFRMANAFMEEPQIAAAIEDEEGFVHARAKCSQE
jgi:hypothetical protein